MRKDPSAPARCLLCLVLAPWTVAGLGCTDKEAEELAAAEALANSASRPLGDHELPVSLRMFDSAPGGAAMVEATDTELRLDGTAVVTLARGRVAATDRSGDVIPKLEARLRSPVKSSVALRLQANIPYETMALVLSTAKKAGIHNAAFGVREVGGSQKAGWLAVNGFSTSSKAEDLPEISGAKWPEWQAFGDTWQEVFEGCKTSASGNCAYLPGNIASGGTLRMELMTSGRGITVNYFRRGLTREQEDVEEKHRVEILNRKKEDFIQGRITHDEMVEALLLGHPSTYALFQFRYQEALKNPSALSKTTAPMCEAQRCAVVLTADAVSSVLHVVSMLGASFPDGTTAPGIAFELPWTARPKPAELTEFIARQQEL
jgi:hypothetical protein